MVIPVLPTGIEWFSVYHVSALLFLTSVTWTGIRWLRLRSRVREVNARLCPFCVTDLEDAPSDAGSCPKCGEEYTPESLREAWRHFASGA